MMKETKRVKIYSALEVANICGVVNQTTINWIRNGYLKAFSTPGGQYRVYKDDLIEFLTSRGIRLSEELLNERGAQADWGSIIIIDDDTSFNNVTARYLKKHFKDTEIYQAFDGFDAGVQLIDKKPGIVVLDIDLPGVNGKELCTRIKNDASFGAPYVIIVTGLEDSALESEMQKSGADCFFKKPVSMSDLFQTILNVTKSDK